MWKVRLYNFWNQGDIRVDQSINSKKLVLDKNGQFRSKMGNCSLHWILDLVGEILIFGKKEFWGQKLRWPFLYLNYIN